MKRSELSKENVNKIFVDFLGWEVKNGYMVILPEDFVFSCYEKQIMQEELGELDIFMPFVPFDTDYRFIMAVVDKIENDLEHIYVDEFFISKSKTSIQIRFENGSMDFTFENGTKKIDQINDVCFDFIIWYNKIKSEYEER